MASPWCWLYAFALYVRLRTPSKPIELAYSGNKHTTLWSTSAQVRQPIGTLNFGDKLEILQRFEDQIKVKTATGQEGWIQEHDLMTADVWETVKDLQTRAATLPVQAKGKTKVLANLHIGPGRDTPRITQLGKAVQVDMLERKVPEVPSSSSANTDVDAGEATPGAKKEDWVAGADCVADGFGFGGLAAGKIHRAGCAGAVAGLCEFGGDVGSLGGMS